MPPPEEKKEEEDEQAKYEKAYKKVMEMRISEIKKELDVLKVSYKGFMEKSDFAQALAKARIEGGGYGGMGGWAHVSMHLSRSLLATCLSGLSILSMHAYISLSPPFFENI